MKKFIKVIFKFVVQVWGLAWFNIRIIYGRYPINPFKKRYSGKLALLANGPSLKEILPKLQTAPEFQNTDFVVLNYFALDDVFTKIKPKHYCLADPMFFDDTFRKEEARRLYATLQKVVDWNMNLYIPHGRLKSLKKLYPLLNPNINIVSLSLEQYSGFESLRFFYYKKGLSMPIVGTVANMAIFVGINSGYSQINLYGVEHTFLDSICVNDKNQLCNKERHFYDSDEAGLKPILRNDGAGENWKIGDYLEGISYMFKSHDLLSAYAKQRGVRIINCTKNSMIDSYERAVNLRTFK